MQKVRINRPASEKKTNVEIKKLKNKKIKFFWWANLAIEYITTRELENAAGELKGKIRIIKTKEDANAMIDFTCPQCGATEKQSQQWSEPFLEGSGANQKFNIRCGKCNHSFKMMKLKKEAKKKK